MSRILMTADAVGGVWTYALDLARALSGEGVAVELAVMGPSPSDAQRTEASRVPGLCLHERAFRLEWMQEPWEDVAAAGEWLLDLEAHTKPDIVHLNGYSHAVLPFRAPVLVVAHSCVLSWHEAVHGGPVPREWDEYAVRVARGIHSAALVVAPTRAMADCITAHYGGARDVRVVANGRCADGFAPAAAKEPFVLTAGRLWDEAKNVDGVCAVADRLSWPVVAAGDDRAPGGARVQHPGVRYAGRLDGPELRALFSRAAIFALPARYEPFGLAPLEAALSGCALVLGDIRSLREVWGDAALFVPPDNRRALAAAIERLASDDLLRAGLAARALERTSLYSVSRMAGEYIALYRELQPLTLAA